MIITDDFRYRGEMTLSWLTGRPIKVDITQMRCFWIIREGGKYTPKGWGGGDHSQGAFTLNPRPLFFVQYYCMPVPKMSQSATPLVEGPIQIVGWESFHRSPHYLTLNSSTFDLHVLWRELCDAALISTLVTIQFAGALCNENKVYYLCISLQGIFVAQSLYLSKEL